MKRVLFAALSLYACSDSTSQPSPVPDAGVDAGETTDAGGADAALPTSARLTNDGRFFRDALGRAAILRGVNARVPDVFDVTFDDGRTAVEEIPAFGEADCTRMAELGFTFLRLPINWSGIEPERDMFDEAYLKRVDETIACAAKAGIYVLVDLHQDAYSKEIGEDGAPLWAIVPEPTMLLEGPLTDLAARRTSAQVLAAFNTFFTEDDASGLQAEYVDMLRHVATRYADEPHVVGIDLFNEPLSLSGTAALAAFHARAAAAVHEVAPELAVTFEPGALWSENGGEKPLGAFPVAGSVYAPHLYALSITGDPSKLETVSRADLLPSFQTAAREAGTLKAMWLVGEFGAGPSTTNYETYLDVHYDLQDEFLVSSALWLWKESSQDAWGLYDLAGDMATERPDMVAVVSRPYAQRIAGTPTRVLFEGTTLTFDYEAALSAPNVVYVPERFTLTRATCDGVEVTPSGAQGNVEVQCGPGSKHTVELTLAAKN